ncbi:MAG: hypothetical protein ACYDEN_02050 [Acidimicrobiales bacterium]
MPNQALLVRSLVELADNPGRGVRRRRPPQPAQRPLRQALDLAAAGVMLAAPSGALQAIASSSAAMRTLELFQLQADQSPCVESYRTDIR